MKVLIVVLLILVVVALVLVAVLVARFGRRNYQRYSGLERQRGAAKQARDAGADRLKSAEHHLVEAQRDLVGLGEHDQAQAIERLRTRLSTLADRLRHATYGYSPVGSPNPVREAELAELQERDAETITEAQRIVELAEHVSNTARAGQVPELEPLRSALDHLHATLDRRRAVS
jgi:hypothetical protein